MPEPIVLVVQLKNRIFRWTKSESQCQPILAVAIHIRIEIHQTVTSDSCEHRAWQCRNQPLQEMNVALQGNLCCFTAWKPSNCSGTSIDARTCLPNSSNRFQRTSPSTAKMAELLFSSISSSSRHNRRYMVPYVPKRRSRTLCADQWQHAQQTQDSHCYPRSSLSCPNACALIALTGIASMSPRAASASTYQHRRERFRPEFREWTDRDGALFRDYVLGRFLC